MKRTSKARRLDESRHSQSWVPPRTGSRPLWRYLLYGLGLTAVLVAAAQLWIYKNANDLPDELENALQLRNLPPNRWVKYHEEKPAAWTRQGHAGMAFDSRRRSLLIFGSDTHGENWDNSVHEFHLLRRRWETHYAAQGPQTYRIDGEGRPVAGDDMPLPWAMHTYDTIEYHAGLDALVVASTTDHNPMTRSASGIRQQPTWFYNLATRTWTMFTNTGQPAPSFFGGSSAYDERRNVLFAYRYAIWELDVDRKEWRRATSEAHHGLHHTMVYDGRRGKLFVFGDYQRTHAVWSYLPGARAGDSGSWEVHQPAGDPVPPYGTVPVAYDAAQDVFILVVDNLEPGSAPQQKASSASTFLYDPEANTYTKLPEGDFNPVGMNYMMAWDRDGGVAFLVTGGQEGAITVWAMKAQKSSSRWK